MTTASSNPRVASLLAVALVQSSACAVEPERDSQIAIISVGPGVDGEQLLQQAASSFYATHDDGYDTLVLWPSRSLLGSAYYLPVANDILGIGYGRVDPDGETFDRGAQFGSARLQGIVRMGSAWPVTRATGGHDSILGVLSQETGHRWGATVHYRGEDGQERSSLVGAGGVHWSFFVASGNSPLGGNDWTEVGDGRYRATPGPPAYSALDLYLMGLMPASEVPPIQLLVDVEDCPVSQCAMWGPTTTAIELGANIESIAIDQIVAAEGPRTPSAAAAPSEFRQAWLYVHPDGEALDHAALDYLEEVRVAWEAHFTAATAGRGTMRTELSRRQR